MITGSDPDARGDRARRHTPTGAEVLPAFDEVGLAPESALLALPEEQRELLVLRQRLAHVG